MASCEKSLDNLPFISRPSLHRSPTKGTKSHCVDRLKQHVACATQRQEEPEIDLFCDPVGDLCGCSLAPKIAST